MFAQTEDEKKSNVGIEWKQIVNILSSMEYNEKSLQSAFKQLASHRGDGLIKVLNEERHSQLKQLFYSKILPFIVELILHGLPSAFGDDFKLLTLPPASDAKRDLTRGQVAVLLGCYFFGLFYDRHTKHINFSHLLQSNAWTPTITKFQCWLHYFDHVRQRVLVQTADMNYEGETYDFENNHFFNKQYITVYRRYLDLDGLEKLLRPDRLYENECPLVPMQIHGSDEGIEDCPDSMHMNFANALIGGHVLSGGAVQEEILFTINTECLVSMLLCRKQMLGNEAIIILGSQQFFNYSGYGHSFKYEGIKEEDEDDDDGKEDMQRLNTCIIGIDALCNCGSKQILIKPMMREIIKSYVGFSCDAEVLSHEYTNGLSTGNWGSGMFGGDPQLKCMLQWISASVAGVDALHYYPRNDKRMKELQVIVDALIQNEKNTVCALWAILNDESLCQQYQNRDMTLFGFI